MSKVFISYSHQDLRLMQRLKKDLIIAGLDVWIDEIGLEPGTDAWQDTIAKAIKNASCLVVMLTPNSKKSEWVNREIEYADAFGVKIIPALISGDEKSVVPISLIRSQRIDLRRNYKSEIKHLVVSISKHLGFDEKSLNVKGIKFINGKYRPADGYKWVNDNPENMQVVWVPGIRFRRKTYIYASKKEGTWSLEPGYEWDSQNPDDLRAHWTPGLEHKDYPNVIASNKEGEWKPAEGFDWVNPIKDDLQVGWTYQKPHSIYRHVITSKRINIFEPAPGYDWLTKNVDDWRVKKVVIFKSKARKVVK